MTIHKIGSDRARPAVAPGAARTPASTREDGREFARIERVDRIDISWQGRELAAGLLRDTEGGSVSRAGPVRRRLDHGFYDDPAVAAKVAERLLASGDLPATTVV